MSPWLRETHRDRPLPGNYPVAGGQSRSNSRGRWAVGLGSRLEVESTAETAASASEPGNSAVDREVDVLDVDLIGIDCVVDLDEPVEFAFELRLADLPGGVLVFEFLDG